MRSTPLSLIHYITPLLLVALLTPTLAVAQLKPDDEAAINYQKARRLIEDDAEQALTIAQSLPTFQWADEQRVELIGQAALSAGKLDVAAQNLLDFADKTDSQKAAFTARMDAAELLVLLGEKDRVDKLLSRLNKDRKRLRGRYSTRRHLNARVIRLLHDIAQGEQNTRRATSLAKDLLIAYPNEDATRRPGLIVTADALSKSQRFSRAKALYRAWAYKDARDEFERFIDDSSRKNVAKWHLAEIALHKLRDNFPLAEKYYGELSQGSSSYSQDALFQLARAEMRQEKYDECMKHLDQYIQRYPRGSKAELVYYYKGWLHYDHRDNKKALKGFDQYIKRYGKRGRRSSYIYGFRAWAYMREQQWDNAIDAWEDMLGFGNPLVAGKAYYWMAYAYHRKTQDKDALKQLDRLRDRYPLSYYGVLGEQLRATIEGKDARASKVWWPEKSGTYDDTPRFDAREINVSRLSTSTQHKWKRVLELAAIDEMWLAREELSPIYSSVLGLAPPSKKDEWIHALGFLSDDYNKMWRASAGRISYLPPVPDKDPLRSVMAYPRAYQDVVEQVAQEFELPTYLIWAIMRQESRYKPTAISHTDAVGALQMIPKTARKVARDLEIKYNPRTFHYPEVGFRYSGFYMKKLMNTFSDLFVPMASSYNSGPQVVARWFKRNPDAEFPWLIEEFEYNEGRAYGRKVGEHMVRYIYLYEKDPEVRAKLLDQLFPLDRHIELPDDVGY